MDFTWGFDWDARTGQVGPEDIRLGPEKSGLAHAADNNSEGVRVCYSPTPTLTRHPRKENGTRRFLETKEMTT